MAMTYAFMTGQLEGEYRLAFDKVECYAMTRGIGEEMQAEKMMDLLDLMLESQKASKPCENVVGNDIERFCENYFADYDKEERIRECLARVQSVAWFVFAFELCWVILSLGDEDFHLMSLTTDVSGYLLGLCGGFLPALLLDVFTKLFLFRIRKKMAGWYAFFSFLFIIGWIVLCCVLMGEQEMDIPVMPVLLVSGGYLLVYYWVTWRKRYRLTGSVKKPKSVYETTFFEIVQSEIADTFSSGAYILDLAKMLLKRYERINRKRQRKGKKLLDTEEFCEMLEWETKRSGWLMCLFFVVITVVAIVVVAMDFTFWDTVLFAAIIIVMEFLIYRFFNRFSKNVFGLRRKVFDECREMGLSLAEYVRYFEETDDAAGERKTGAFESENKSKDSLIL